MGLAEAYRVYGFFFQSEAVERWGHVYRRQGFLDKSATFDGRITKALEYFEGARGLYSDHHAYDRLTNVDLNMGFTFERHHLISEACKAYDHALRDYQNNARENPSARQTPPSGFSSLPEFLEAQKKRVKCYSQNSVN